MTSGDRMCWAFVQPRHASPAPSSKFCLRGAHGCGPLVRCRRRGDVARWNGPAMLQGNSRNTEWGVSPGGEWRSQGWIPQRRWFYRELGEICLRMVGELGVQAGRQPPKPSSWTPKNKAWMTLWQSRREGLVHDCTLMAAQGLLVPQEVAPWLGALCPLRPNDCHSWKTGWRM